MRSLLGCCLFGFLLATGTCLECEHCFGIGNNCTGITRKCAAEEDTCTISLKQFYQAPTTATYVSKSCAPSHECAVGLRELDFGHNLRLRLGRTCCTGDACKKTSAPVLPPSDMKPNDLYCPGCLGLFSPECNAEPVSCTGNSTQCLELSGQLSMSFWRMDIAMKGCANAGMCHNLKAGHHAIGEVQADLSEAKCTPASKKSP